MIDKRKIDWSLVRAVEDAEAVAKEAQRKLSEHLTELSPFNKGDIVRDKDSGARYRVDGMSGHVHRGEPSMNIQATSVYTTGRRDASSTSYLSGWNLEKVTE